MVSPLLNALFARLGSQQAALELQWMKRAVQAQPHRSLSEMLNRRIIGEPLQYILGDTPFGPLSLITRPPVLIPRPETEDWVMKLAHRLSSTSFTKPKYLLDLGTGSGCIPLLLCHLFPPGSLHTHGIDISPHAIQLATDNAEKCDIPTPSHHISKVNTFKTTLASFLNPTFPEDASLKPPYDIITSNPPYITWSEYLQLPLSVSDYEDSRALFGGPAGLDFYYAIARIVRQKGFLRSGAVVALEVGPTQAEEVETIMYTTGDLRHIEIWCDPWNKQRTVVARKP